MYVLSVFGVSMFCVCLLFNSVVSYKLEIHRHLKQQFDTDLRYVSKWLWKKKMNFFCIRKQSLSLSSNINYMWIVTLLSSHSEEDVTIPSHDREVEKGSGMTTTSLVLIAFIGVTSTIVMISMAVYVLYTFVMDCMGCCTIEDLESSRIT